MQMAAQFLAGMFRHASANSHGEMIAAREGPQVALKMMKKFHANSLGLRRHKITERHFQVVARQRASAREQGIARARGDDDEVRFDARLADRQFGAFPRGIHLTHARTNDAAAGGFGAFQEKPVQHRSRINDNRLIERQQRAISLAGNEFDACGSVFLDEGPFSRKGYA